MPAPLIKYMFIRYVMRKEFDFLTYTEEDLKTALEALRNLNMADYGGYHCRINVQNMDGVVWVTAECENGAIDVK